jgi:hypothetical protein
VGGVPVVLTGFRPVFCFPAARRIGKGQFTRRDEHGTMVFMIVNDKGRAVYLFSHAARYVMSATKFEVALREIE